MATIDHTTDLPALPSWDGPAIGLLDLDAFFASVEQLDHPEWRGKPLIVGGSPEMRGVVSTASYEARKFGVHSAMPSAQARKLCPGAIWTQGHFAHYREMSARVMGVLETETPLVEQVSIDEAFFDVTPGRYSHESPVSICRRIQESVSCLGITCSIGIGVNKTVAKIASEREKPRGLTVVYPGTEQAFLAPLPASAMSGIGAVTASRLAEMGIRTLGELSRADDARMRSVFGTRGPQMVERAAGRETSRVRAAVAHEDAKSVSNERTFEHDITDEDEILAAIMHVASLAGRRLRTKGLRGQTVTLKIKYDALHARTAQRRLPSPTNDERVFGTAACELLGELWHAGMPVRLIGVGMSGFEAETAEQMALFGAGDERPGRDRASDALSEVTDQLKERFGDDMVGYGRDLRFRHHVSDTTPMGKSDF